MKRLLLNLLCLLFAYSCFAAEPIQLARMSPWVAGSGGSVTACTDTQKDSSSGTAQADGIGYSSSTFGKAYSWTAGSSYTLRKFRIILYRTGDPYTNTTFDSVTAQICNDDGGTPPKPTNCTTADNTITTESMDTSTGTWYEFTINSGKVLSSSARYWFTAYPTSGVGDASNYVNIKFSNSGGSESKATTNNTMVWSNADTDVVPNVITYACE